MIDHSNFTHNLRGRSTKDSYTQWPISGHDPVTLTGSTYVQCESQKNPPPEIFWHFFPNGWEFFVQILHACYTFLSTLDYKFLFNYLQL